MLEAIQDSEAFDSYSYNVVKITRNRQLMLSWLFEEELLIYEE